jgi:NADH-quinone oxidoreductase subunit A
MLDFINNFLNFFSSCMNEQFYFIYFNNFNFSLLSEEYLSIFLIIIVASILAGVIFALSYILAIQNPETEKLSSYECGFEPYEDARLQFDVKFYLVAILFIVFDIEAMFLYPWCISISQLSITGFWSMVDFIIELGVGFIYVWLIGALNWN